MRITEIEGCEFCGIKENCNNYKLGLIEGRHLSGCCPSEEGYVKISDFLKYNGRIAKAEDVFEFVERLLKCSNCDRDFYDKKCPTCYSKEGYVKLEDVTKKIRSWGRDMINPCPYYLEQLIRELKALAQNHSPMSAGDDALTSVRTTATGIVRDKASIPNGAICKPETLSDNTQKEEKLV